MNERDQDRSNCERLPDSWLVKVGIKIKGGSLAEKIEVNKYLLFLFLAGGNNSKKAMEENSSSYKTVLSFGRFKVRKLQNGPTSEQGKHTPKPSADLPSSTQAEENGSLSAPPDYETSIDACPRYEFYALSALPGRRKIRPTLDMLRNAEPVRGSCSVMIKEKEVGLIFHDNLS